ncbi:MAG: hypothetical protein IK017_02960 [Paludibacteraceae bacterium]|nr:hypothetical protein [Paludibacteraceae bacterium]MBO7636129.1 hypothetical protein [Paludibacteraceae bacterium]MBR5971594.1 hypothetical protein [Paludibacteraceae bacterium]
MGKLMRYLGILIVLLGVLILLLHFFEVFTSNTALGLAGFIMILGLAAHILLNKYYVEE